MLVNRRDLIRLSAGGVCGAVLTPVPWRLLNDTANWSQNWSWTPILPRGEAAVKRSTCTMCSTGCTVTAKCVNNTAVGIEGTLCPAGVAGHTAAYHRRRLRASESDKNAIAAIAHRLASGARTGILDLGPERSMSSLYRTAAEHLGDATYLRVADQDEVMLDAVALMIGREPGSLGLDFEHTQTLISFGSPVLEMPGPVLNRWRSGTLKVVQVEPRQSRTALAAHTWIPSLAIGIPDTLDVAGNSLVVGEDPAIAAMNIALGAVGREGGILPRSPLPWKQKRPTRLSSAPDHSLDVLFIDSSRCFDTPPWRVIERKLSDKAIVVALSYRADAITAHSHFSLPVPAPFESIEDAIAPPAAVVPSYAISAPLIPGSQPSALDHMNAILQAAGKAPVDTTIEQEIKLRAAAIHDQFKPKATAEETFKNLLEGNRWVGERSREQIRAHGPMPPRTQLVTVAEGRPLILLVNSNPDETLPLMSKLYQESGLYPPSTIARINPQTATQFGLSNGSKIVVDTVFGSRQRETLVDPAVMPGVVETSGDIADICTDGSTGNWRSVAAAVRRA